MADSMKIQGVRNFIEQSMEQTENYLGSSIPAVLTPKQRDQLAIPPEYPEYLLSDDPSLIAHRHQLQTDLDELNIRNPGIEGKYKKNAVPKFDTAPGSSRLRGSG